MKILSQNLNFREKQSFVKLQQENTLKKVYKIGSAENTPKFMHPLKNLLLQTPLKTFVCDGSHQKNLLKTFAARLAQKNL